MKQIKFYYNTKTCRYEPHQTSIWGMLVYTLCFLAISAMLFIGIQVIHGKYFETEKARTLRLENRALKTHYATLQNKVGTIEQTLESLKQQESSLHLKLFDSPLPQTQQTKTTDATILLADASDFREVLLMLKNKTEQIAQSSAISESAFSEMMVTKEDVPFIATIPSVQPIRSTESSALVSGFGKRINPFHKGNYFHQGTDFAAPRGTEVIATGSGKVVHVVKNASLQAGYGNYIEISHNNGIVTRYAHLQDVLVKAGQSVLKGTVIGTVGMSGGATAPHVHYEILRKGKPVNPLPYMMEGLSSKEYVELQKAGNIKNQSLD
jgi:murein DD-endopeptidase MepM/ murein hydrolase activator NlpD